MIRMGLRRTGVVFIFSRVLFILCSPLPGNERTEEQIAIESFAQHVQNKINNMTDEYDRKTADNIHTMWFDKMFEVEENLRTSSGPVLKHEHVVDDSEVELFAQRVRRKIENWPDVEHPVGFEIHEMWHKKGLEIEKNLKKKTNPKKIV